MRTPEYHDLAPLVRLTGIAIWMQTACYVVSLVADVIDYAMRVSLARQGTTFENSDELPVALVNVFVGITGLITTIAIIFAAVLVLRAIYRANRNLHARGVSGLEYTPGWCVGWFFIPIAGLWKPYQASKEIWVASHDPMQFSVDRPGLMPVWWTLFLISNVASTMSGRFALMGTPEAQMPSTVLSLICDAASIPEGLILLALLRQIAAAQYRTLNIDMAFA